MFAKPFDYTDAIVLSEKQSSGFHSPFFHRTAGYTSKRLKQFPSSQGLWELWDQELATLVYVLSLLPPAYLTLDGLRKLSLSPDATFWTGFWLLVGTFFRLCNVVYSTLDTIWRLPYMIKRPHTRRLRLEGSDVPTVDIIITACKESREIIMDTVRAACVIDYPRNSCRIIIADDGADMELRYQVEALQQDYSNLYYYSRIKIPGVDHKFKAGNINSTLEWTASFAWGASEWFAVLDCDMIPEPDWLRALLGHATKDSRVGMALPPQGFYNIPANDMLFQSTEIQFALEDPLRDCFSGVWCSGSGFLARRAAIDDIGGFPDSSLCEDILCSMKLNGAGWKSILVNEPLQWGLMPDSIEAHVEQRRRWAVGTIQNALQLGFCLDKRRLWGFSPIQRFQGFVYCIGPFFNYVVRPLGFVMLPWCLVFGDAVILAPTTEMLRIQLGWNLFNRLAYLCREISDSKAVSFHLLRQKAVGAFWLGPVIAKSVVSELISGGKRRGGRLKFVSSGSINSPMAERDVHARASLKHRLRTVLLDERYFCNTLVLLNAVVCFAIRLHMDMRQPGSSMLYLLRNSLSPGFGWEEYFSFLIPILYAIIPPTEPERHKLMKPDVGTGVWRAKEEHKGVRWTKLSILQEIPAYAFLAWSGLALLMVKA